MNKSLINVLLAVLLTSACGEPENEPASFSIHVSASTSPRPLPFSGTYQYVLDDRRITRDLTGAGSFETSFVADDIVYVRVIATARDGIYSLRIRRDGDVIFASPAQNSSLPITYGGESLTQ